MANIMNMFPSAESGEKVVVGTVSGGLLESITVSGLDFEPANFMFAGTTVAYNANTDSKVICVARINGVTYGGVSGGSQGAYGVEIISVTYSNGALTVTVRALGTAARFIGTYAYILTE